MKERKVKQTEIGAIPEEWEVRKLKELLINQGYIRGPFGSALRRPELKSEGIPVYEQANAIYDHRVFRFFIDKEKYRKLRRFTVEENDIILSCSGTLGKVTIIKKGDPKGIISQALLILRPDVNKVNPKFLKYFFQSNMGYNAIVSRSLGSVQVNVAKREIIENIELAVPSLQEQSTITIILSAYDDLIETNRRRIQLLEEIARALYREWFVHFRIPGYEDVELVDSELGEIPEGWRVTPFTEMAEILSGGTPRTHKPEYWNGSIPFFTPRDIKGGFYILDTERHITKLGLDNCKSEAFPKDTVFITARGTVGRVVMPAVPMSMSQTSYALRGRNNIEQAFVFYKTLECVDQLKKMTHGAVFDTIITDTFQMLKICLPPLEYIDSFCSIVSSMLDLILDQTKQNSILQKTRDILLPKLVSGQLNISNLDLEAPSDTHKTSKYSDQSTLDKWLDGDDQHDPS